MPWRLKILWRKVPEWGWGCEQERWGTWKDRMGEYVHEEKRYWCRWKGTLKKVWPHWEREEWRVYEEECVWSSYSQTKSGVSEQLAHFFFLGGGGLKENMNDVSIAWSRSITLYFVVCTPPPSFVFSAQLQVCYQISSTYQQRNMCLSRVFASTRSKTVESGFDCKTFCPEWDWCCKQERWATIPNRT